MYNFELTLISTCTHIYICICKHMRERAIFRLLFVRILQFYNFVRDILRADPRFSREYAFHNVLWSNEIKRENDFLLAWGCVLTVESPAASESVFSNSNIPQYETDSLVFLIRGNRDWQSSRSILIPSMSLKGFTSPWPDNNKSGENKNGVDAKKRIAYIQQG